MYYFFFLSRHLLVCSSFSTFFYRLHSLFQECHLLFLYCILWELASLDAIKTYLKLAPFFTIAKFAFSARNKCHRGFLFIELLIFIYYELTLKIYEWFYHHSVSRTFLFLVINLQPTESHTKTKYVSMKKKLRKIHSGRYQIGDVFSKLRQLFQYYCVWDISVDALINWLEFCHLPWKCFGYWTF